MRCRTPMSVNRLKCTFIFFWFLFLLPLLILLLVFQIVFSLHHLFHFSLNVRWMFINYMMSYVHMKIERINASTRSFILICICKLASINSVCCCNSDDLFLFSHVQKMIAVATVTVISMYSFSFFKISCILIVSNFKPILEIFQNIFVYRLMRWKLERRAHKNKQKIPLHLINETDLIRNWFWISMWKQIRIHNWTIQLTITKRNPFEKKLEKNGTTQFITQLSGIIECLNFRFYLSFLCVYPVPF